MAPSMASVNHRWRRNFFACFNSSPDEDAPSASPPPSSDDECGRRRKTARHNSFSDSLKAAFYKTPLVKKLRTRKLKRDSYRSTSTTSSTFNESSVPDEIFQENSDRSSLFSSTSVSCASSISSNSRSGSGRMNESSAFLDLNQTTGTNKHAVKMVCSSSKCSYNFATGMYVFLVCLVALIFGGKAFAIVTCTSTWLFFAPCSHPSSRGGEGGSVNNNVVESADEYKKRVIMEGLLWRNRTRSII